MNFIHAAVTALLWSSLSEANHLRQSRDLSTQNYSKTGKNNTSRHLGWLADMISSVATRRAVKSTVKAATVGSWDVVVNNANVIPPPDTATLEEAEEAKTFSSYNPPSVNAAKDVVFRARSTG
jgi:NAD(P)-dependent dehydrogenase (short-subunit alcohol dehydrogenase family)